jgi:predicted Zn-dependent protease with MMP-like domain
VQYRHVLRHRIAAFLLIAFLASGRAVAEGQDLAAYSARIEEVAQELVQNIRPVLDPHAQQVLDDIVFEAPQTWVTNAVAHRGFGSRRIIEFNAGFLAVTDWLSLAMIADWAGHEGCLKEYSEYLSELVGHNSRRTWKGKERKHVHDFTQYAANTRGHCQGAADNSPGTQRQQELRDEILHSVIATVLLHEIGHHVLDHLGGYGNNNFMQRRMREVDADRWAIITAVKARYELRTAVPLFLFLAATGGGTLEDEIRSSHPSGLRRVRDLLVQTRALLDSKDPVNAHILDASIDDLNRSLR